jgi:hypothetical protein
LILGQRGVVSGQGILALHKRPHDGVNHGLRGFKLGKIAFEGLADAGQEAQGTGKPACLEIEFPGIEVFDGHFKINQTFGHLTAFLTPSGQLSNGFPEHAATVGRFPLGPGAQIFHGGDVGVTQIHLGGVLRVERQNLADKVGSLLVQGRVHLFVHTNGGWGGEADLLLHLGGIGHFQTCLLKRFLRHNYTFSKAKGLAVLY